MTTLVRARIVFKAAPIDRGCVFFLFAPGDRVNDPSTFGGLHANPFRRRRLLMRGLKGFLGHNGIAPMDAIGVLTLLCETEKPTGGSCWHRRRLKQNNTILDLITSSRGLLRARWRSGRDAGLVTSFRLETLTWKLILVWCKRSTLFLRSCFFPHKSLSPCFVNI